jgi:hypothetical protein
MGLESKTSTARPRLSHAQPGYLFYQLCPLRSHTLIRLTVRYAKDAAGDAFRVRKARRDYSARQSTIPSAPDVSVPSMPIGA